MKQVFQIQKRFIIGMEGYSIDYITPSLPVYLEKKMADTVIKRLIDAECRQSDKGIKPGPVNYLRYNYGFNSIEEWNGETWDTVGPIYFIETLELVDDWELFALISSPFR